MVLQPRRHRLDEPVAQTGAGVARAHHAGDSSEAQLRYLTEVDQHHHVALAAVDGSNIVGVARFVREGIADAELAIAIVDEWQGRGLGTALMAALVDRSLKQGVTRFQAYVLADNEPMLRLLAGLGHQRWSGTGPERRSRSTSQVRSYSHVTPANEHVAEAAPASAR